MKRKNYISSFGTWVAKIGQTTSKHCCVLSLGAVLLDASSARAVTITPLGSAILASGEIVSTVQIVLEPGDVVPWHYHSGYGWAMILSGTFTKWDGCGGLNEVYQQGEGFKEEPGIVHTAQNAGAEQVVVLWTEIYPACQPPTIYADGPSCAGQSGRTRAVKIPACP